MKTLKRHIKKPSIDGAVRSEKTPDLKREIRRLRRDLSGLGLFYENIINGIPCGVWVADKDDMICFANHGMEMIAGATKQKLIGHSISEGADNRVSDLFLEHFQEAKGTLEPVYFSSMPVMTPAGRQTYQSGWFIPRKSRGRYDGMICILQDITNQKEMSRALKESEAKYQDIVQNVNSVIMRTDTLGNVNFFNRFAQDFLGFTESEMLGRNVIGSIFKANCNNCDAFQNLLSDLRFTDKPQTISEFENVRKDGSKAWIAWTVRAVFDEKGSIGEILWVGNDVTGLKHKEELLQKSRFELEQAVESRTAELKRANIELQREIDERKWVHTVLRKSQEKYRLLVENANEAIIVIQDNFVRFINPKGTRITGYSDKEISERPFLELFHHDDRDMVMERYLKRLKGNTVPSVYPCRIIDREGAVKWIEINSVLISWMGRPAALAFFNNITERKLYEEKLRLLESAIQQTKDSIIITTARPEHFSSKIVFVNNAFTRMTGYTEEDVLGRLSVILQGPKTDSTEWFKLENPQSRPKTFQFETVAIRKNGTKFDVEWQISPIRDEKGKITHFISTQRDITNRKQSERALHGYQEQLRSLAYELSLTEERERRMIAANLHDHIGQILAIAKIRIGALSEGIADKTVLKELSDIRAFIEEAIVYTKSLTFELSPPVLYELGLEAAIEWLCEKMQREHQIIFELKADGDFKKIDSNIAIMLFRAVRELCINAVKHAKADHVAVELVRIGDDALIKVKDNGSGFILERTKGSSSYGLFSIRERLRHLGGLLHIDNDSKGGSVITMRFPFRFTPEGGSRI